MIGVSELDRRTADARPFRVGALTVALGIVGVALAGVVLPVDVYVGNEPWDVIDAHDRSNGVALIRDFMVVLGLAAVAYVVSTVLIYRRLPPRRGMQSASASPHGRLPTVTGNVFSLAFLFFWSGTLPKASGLLGPGDLAEAWVYVRAPVDACMFLIAAVLAGAIGHGLGTFALAAWGPISRAMPSRLRSRSA